MLSDNNQKFGSRAKWRCAHNASFAQSWLRAPHCKDRNTPEAGLQAGSREIFVLALDSVPRYGVYTAYSE